MSRLLPLLFVMLAACQPASLPERRLADSLAAIAGAHPDVLFGIAVRDDATGTTFVLNGDSLMHAASTMKVPVMIETFRQAQQGRFSLDDSLVVKNTFTSIQDGSAYAVEDDSDPDVLARVGRRVTVRYLVERMITHSSNLATNILIEKVGADSVQATIEGLGTTHMRVYRGVEDIPAYRAGLNNTATARDLSLLMQKIGQGEAVGPAADAEMRAILLRQHYNETIPAGLPPGLPVAHKTGFITGINHDAALVLPPGQPPYTLVILTRGFESPDSAHAVGAHISRVVYGLLRGTPVHQQE